MNTNQKNQNSLSIKSQARLLVSQERIAKRDRQLSMRKRASDEIGLTK